MSQTDGTWICGRCGEWMAQCGLCSDLPEMLIKGPNHADYQQQRLAGERELNQQSRSIRAAADKRQGW